MFDKKAFVVAAALVGLGGACASQTIDGAGSDPGAGGKADDDDIALAVAPADEPLWSNGLRAQVCDAIVGATAWDTTGDRDAFDAGCQDHQFTITEKRTSTLYAHQDDLQPMTLGMSVKVSDGSRDFTAELDRVWRPNTYRFVWEASAPDGRAARDEYISDVADDIGEYFDDSDPRLRPIALADLPAEVLTRAEQRAADLTRQWQEEHPEEPSSASVYEEAYEILGSDGEPVGYVLQLAYYIDAPLFDGGGETLYMNHLGEIVEAVEWWG
jgi:hypothetical protein